MRNAGHGVAIGAETETVEFARAGRAGRHAFIRAIEDASVDELAVSLGLDGEVAVAVVLMDCGSIANAPIDQTSAPVNEMLPVPKPPSGNATYWRRAPRIHEPLVDRGRMSRLLFAILTIPDFSS